MINAINFLNIPGRQGQQVALPDSRIAAEQHGLLQLRNIAGRCLHGLDFIIRKELFPRLLSPYLIRRGEMLHRIHLQIPLIHGFLEHSLNGFYLRIDGVASQKPRILHVMAKVVGMAEVEDDALAYLLIHQLQRNPVKALHLQMRQNAAHAAASSFRTLFSLFLSGISISQNEFSQGDGIMVKYFLVDIFLCDCFLNDNFHVAAFLGME